MTEYTELEAGYQFGSAGTRIMAPRMPWSETAFHHAIGFDDFMRRPTAPQIRAGAMPYRPHRDTSPVLRVERMPFVLGAPEVRWGDAALAGLDAIPKPANRMKRRVMLSDLLDLEGLTNG